MEDGFSDAREPEVQRRCVARTRRTSSLRTTRTAIAASTLFTRFRVTAPAYIRSPGRKFPGCPGVGGGRGGGLPGRGTAGRGGSGFWSSGGTLPGPVGSGTPGTGAGAAGAGDGAAPGPGITGVVPAQLLASGNEPAQDVGVPIRARRERRFEESVANSTADGASPAYPRKRVTAGVPADTALERARFRFFLATEPVILRPREQEPI